MAMLPKLKIKALVSFPANVFGGTGISIDKANGNFTIDLNYSEFAFQGTLPTGSNVLVWDPVANVYTLIPPSATGGISDAPTDGKTYGRKLAAWVDAWDSVVLTGNPTAPTPSPGDNDTSVATTAFVSAAMASAGTPATLTPLVESGLGAVGTSLKYAREDHVHPAGGGGGGGASVLVADTAPTGATVNSLWFESDTGILYIYYADGNSSQWVAIAAGGIDVGAVRFDSAQTLTSDSGVTKGQRSQARSNIGAAPFDALAYTGMQFNGSMDVDQPNAGASIVVPTGTVLHQNFMDGWWTLKTGTNAFSVQQATSVFPGYSKELKMTVTTAQSTIGTDVADIRHTIEGYRISRLGWGTAAAQPLTVGFWVKSSVAGSLFVFAMNSAQDTFPSATTTIASSGVLQFVTAIISPPAIGTTWLVDNGVGIILSIRVAGSGSINIFSTVGNTFEITGFIVLPGIEAPSAARSPLIMRPFDQELLTCQRYWYATNSLSPTGVGSPAGVGSVGGVSTASNSVTMSVKWGNAMRANPSVTHWNNGVANQVRDSGGAVGNIGTCTFYVTRNGCSFMVPSTGTPFFVGRGYDFDLIADARL